MLLSLSPDKGRELPRQRATVLEEVEPGKTWKPAVAALIEKAKT